MHGHLLKYAIALERFDPLRRFMIIGTESTKMTLYGTRPILDPTGHDREVTGAYNSFDPYHGDDNTIEYFVVELQLLVILICLKLQKCPVRSTELARKTVPADCRRNASPEQVCQNAQCQRQYSGSGVRGEIETRAVTWMFNRALYAEAMLLLEDVQQTAR